MENQDSQSENRQTSQPQQSLENFLSARMRWVLNLIPAALQPNLESQATHMECWVNIIDEIGRDKFSVALKKAAENSEYFPVPARIRKFAGISEEQQADAGAQAAWIFIRKYISQWGSTGDPHYRGKGPEFPPALAPRIAHAVRYVGGLQAIEYAPEKELPWIQKRFMEAWSEFPNTSEALLALESAEPVRRLPAGGNEHMRALMTAIRESGGVKGMPQ